jgi:hypothetical protein
MNLDPKLSVVMLSDSNNYIKFFSKRLISDQSILPGRVELLTISPCFSPKDILIRARELAKSQWIVFLDEHSFPHSQFLERLVNLTSRLGNTSVIFSCYTENLEIPEHPRWFSSQLLENLGYRGRLAPCFFSNIVFHRNSIIPVANRIKLGPLVPYYLKKIEFTILVRGLIQKQPVLRDCDFIKVYRRVPKKELTRIFFVYSEFIHGFVDFTSATKKIPFKTLRYLFWPCRGPRKFSFQLQAWYLIGQFLGRVITL